MARQIEIHEALMNLRPNTRFSVTENDFDKIEWQDEVIVPSREEIETEMTRLQVIEDSLHYQKQRKTEYPSFADQFDLLYHDGYSGWKDAIDAIKNKYPKP